MHAKFQISQWAYEKLIPDTSSPLILGLNFVKKWTIEQFFSQCVNVRKYEPKHALLKFCKKSKASDYYPPSRHSFVCNLFVFYLLKRIRAELYLQFFSLFFFLSVSLFLEKFCSFSLSPFHGEVLRLLMPSENRKRSQNCATTPHLSLFHTPTAGEWSSYMNIFFKVKFT